MSQCSHFLQVVLIFSFERLMQTAVTFKCNVNMNGEHFLIPAFYFYIAFIVLSFFRKKNFFWIFSHKQIPAIQTVAICYDWKFLWKKNLTSTLNININWNIFVIYLPKISNSDTCLNPSFPLVNLSSSADFSALWKCGSIVLSSISWQFKATFLKPKQIFDFQTGQINCRWKSL